MDDSLQERTGGRRQVTEAAASAPAALTIASPSSPSRKYDLAELRALAGSEQVPVSRLLPSNEVSAASVVVVTSRNGSVSAFSLAEISSSSDGPSLDVSSSAPRLVAAGGRGLDDVVSIELRVLAPAK